MGITDSLIAAVAFLQGERSPVRKLRHFERVPVLTPVEVS